MLAWIHAKRGSWHARCISKNIAAVRGRRQVVSPTSAKRKGETGTMWDSIRNLRTCEIALKNDLGGAEREWLIKEMLLKDGIECALYHPAGSQCLIVQYDADITSPLHMVDFLSFCGVASESVPPPEADSERALRDGHAVLAARDSHPRPVGTAHPPRVARKGRSLPLVPDKHASRVI